MTAAELGIQGGPERPSAMLVNAQGILYRYQRSMESNQFALEGVKVNNLVLRSVADQVPVLNVITDYALDKMEGYLESEGQKSALASLTSGYAQFQAKFGLDKLNGMPAEDAVAALIKSDSQNVVRDLLTGLNEDPIAQANLMALIVSQHEAALSSALSGAVGATQEVETAKRQLTAVAKTLSTYQIATDKKLVTLSKQVASLASGLEQVTKEVRGHGEQISALAGILFGGASTRQRIELIDAGLYVGPDPSKVAELRQTLEARLQFESVVATVSDISNSATNLMTIATNFGMDIPPEIASAVNTGQVAAAALTNLAAGNYLGAVAAVSGLFGGGGDGGAAARHAQIMQQLAVINRKLDAVIDLQQKTIVLIREGFTAVLAGQKAIQENLVVISNQVATLSRENRRQFDQLGLRVEDVLGNIVGQRLVGLRQCGFFGATLPVDRESWLRVKRHYEAHRNELKTCMNFVLNTVADVGTARSALLLSNFPNEFQGGIFGTDSLVALNEYRVNELPHMQRLLTHGSHLFLKGHANWQERVFGLAATAASDFGEMATSWTTAVGSERMSISTDLRTFLFYTPPVAGGGTTIARPSPLNPLDVLVQTIEPGLAGLVVQYAAEYHPYFFLVDRPDDGGPFRTAQQQLDQALEAAAANTSAGEVLVRNALSAVQIAIAQQSLGDGAVLIPIAHELMAHPLEPGDQQSSEIVRACIEVISTSTEINDVDRLKGQCGYIAPRVAETLRVYGVPKGEFDNLAITLSSSLIYTMYFNDVFRTNLVAYEVGINAGRALSGYETFLSELNSSEIERLIGPDFDVSYSENGLVASYLGAEPTPLPTPSDVAERVMLRSPGLTNLLRVREQVSAELTTYDLAKTVTDGEWQMLLSRSKGRLQ